MSYHLNILSALSRTSSPQPETTSSSSLPPPPPPRKHQHQHLSSSNLTLEDDKLARESDVTVSNITSSEAEYRGFSIHIISSIGLIIWIIWTLLPDYLLNKLSINYYPNKYWSIIIPNYSLILMIFIYWIFALYNIEILTLPLNDIHCIIDENSVFPGEKTTSHNNNNDDDDDDDDSIMKNSIEYIHKAPSGVWDLPITLVNDVLYE
ncbi:phosphatidylinositol N-acetylglucosaminyltransferase subunit, putative [Candida dubliniensis CD36]|uniref:Phosphatidylinositol N-acetylglucosaminyltransferase subunit, putative n=1 Tax=Candida dubliniensis (strain CD36 / ATCC MYA-646 / CBS 7987 / NCPF 3949 / NRRL Y-17841) TaxID=573826 RepID=B9WBI6_CANDC|nr:phosphatidylinositol N-acetylglucosaminyltransferase subunit, putative [Candida dubliniensis CD36]CAX43757.1 phosphatidylinositol N-acetylglucosaminyltransferase subunit, putative [Candida dubliniensis CD36]